MPPSPSRPRSRPRGRHRLPAAAVVLAVTTGSLLSAAAPALAHGGDDLAPHVDSRRVAEEVRQDEVAALGREHAEEHARMRAAVRGVGDYPQTTRRPPAPTGTTP